MKLRVKKTIALHLISFIAMSAQGAETNIAGSWWNLFFEMPGSVSFAGNTLTGGEDFLITTEKTEYTGTQFQNLIAATERGSYQVSTNLAVIHRTEEGEFLRHMNLGADMMIEADGYLDDSDEELTSLSISVRPPVSLAVADLAGQWNYRYFETGNRATAPNLNIGTQLNWAGLSVETLDRINITADGVVSHPDVVGNIGAFFIQQDLPVLIASDGQEGFFINARKDIMLKISEDVPDAEDWGFFTVSWLVKSPETLTVNDIAGRWQIAEIFGPENLVIGGQPGSPSVLGGDGFAEGTFSITLLADGRGLFIDPDNEVLREVAWTIQPGGMVRIVTGEDIFTLAINRSKDFGVAAFATQDRDIQMVLAVKYSHDPVLPTPPNAKIVEMVSVEKSIQHVQTSASSVILRNRNPENPVYGGPYGMEVVVEGADLSSIAIPTVIPPAGSTIGTAQPEWFNGGRLNYGEESQAWGLGPNGGNWGAEDRAEVDALFGNGVYTVKVLGSTFSLNLSGDNYPPPPIASVTGGEWQNGIYVIDPAREVTISLPVFPAFGSNVNGRVAVEFDDELLPRVVRLHKGSSATEPLKAAIPAHTLLPGESLALDLCYNAIVDESFARAGTFAMAAYSSYTEIIVMAPPILRMERVGGNWNLVWSGGILQKAEQVNGPWTTVNGAASPIQFLTPEAKGFYRVRAESQ